MKDSSPNLDLLRSCAVVLVVLSHVAKKFGWSGPHYDVVVLGSVGVAMFFVHTTVVLMMSLERHGAKAGPFLIRRFLRIYPLAVTIVLCMAAIDWWAGREIYSFAVVSNLLLVQNLTAQPSTPIQLWSLPYEVQMYLILPALYLMIQRHDVAVLRIVRLWAGSVVLIMAAWAASMRHELFQCVPCFLPGLLAYILARQRKPVFGSAAMFALIAVATAVIPALVSYRMGEIPLLWVFCLALGFLIPAGRELTSARLARGAKTVAQYSYGIYITHMLAIEIAFDGLGLPALGQWAAFILVLAGLSWAAYHGVEKRGIALGKRLSARLRSTPRAQALDTAR